MSERDASLPADHGPGPVPLHIHIPPSGDRDESAEATPWVAPQREGLDLSLYTPEQQTVTDSVFRIVREKTQAYVRSVLSGQPDFLDRLKPFTEPGLVRFVSETITLDVSARIYEKYHGEQDPSRRVIAINPHFIDTVVNDALARWLATDRMTVDDLVLITRNVTNMLDASGVQLEGAKREQLRFIISEIIAGNKKVRHFLRNMAYFTPLIEVDMLPARDLSAEIVKDEGVAEELALRHQSVNRAVQIGEALDKHFRFGLEEPLHEMQRIIANKGAFLMDYTTEMMRKRIVSPEWVIARAKGRKINFHKEEHAMFQGDEHQLPTVEDSRFAADIQVHVPNWSGETKPYFEWPDPQRGDEFFPGGQAVLADIQNNPQRGGCVSDFCAEDAYAHQRFASTARTEAFEYIRQEHSWVRYLVAELFVIEGLENTRGDILTLDNPMMNTPSLTAHINSRKYPFKFGWQLKRRRVPVRIPADPPGPKTSQLIVSWLALIHDLHR